MLVMNNSGKQYTETEEQYIKEHYPAEGVEIAEKLGRSQNSVRCKARKLGIFLKQRDENYIDKGCIIEDCDKLHHARGYCRYHYKKLWKKGKFSDKKCIIKGCDELAPHEDGLCEKHYRNDYYEKNKVHILKSCNNRYHSKKKYENPKRKAKALAIYGGKCQHCDCGDLVVLQWHHKNGQKTRRGENQVTLCNKIVRIGKTLDDIMLLCANCHIHQDIKDGRRKRPKHIKYFSKMNLEEEELEEELTYE